MLTRLRLVIGLLACVLLLGGLSTLSATSADAAGLARVSTPVRVAPDWYNAKLRARWKAVRGATGYQVRWATSKARLGRAKPYATTKPSAVSPALNRCVGWYVQARALRGTAAGPWSKASSRLVFSNRGAAKAAISGVGLDNAVQLNWRYTANAARYRVRWSAAPWGKWAGGTAYVGGGWFNQYARSATLALPATPYAGDRFMGVAYGNPVFAQIESNNPCAGGTPRTSWIPVYPKAPDPGPGDPVRIGTYNLELFPNSRNNAGRINLIAQNIASHSLQVVLLQESNGETASSVVAALGSGWTAVPSDSQGNQILYRSDTFSVVSHGGFNITSRSSSYPIVIPWARLHRTGGGQNSQDLMVVSMHLSENANASQMQKRADAGSDARTAIDAINRANTANLPVVSAGDYRYLREPFGEWSGYVEGPPTFIRAGYYDALSAVTKIGYQYTSVNGHKAQVVSESGVGPRADYILIKGFRSSALYHNVANWPSAGATTPSDHNLVYADLVVPFGS